MTVTLEGWENFTGPNEAECETSQPSIEVSDGAGPGGDAIDCATGVTCVTLTVTGGVGPYTWDTTRGQIVGSGASVQLCPPTNNGSGVGGLAWMIKSTYKANSCFHFQVNHRYGCDGALMGCFDVGSAVCGCAPPNSCTAVWCKKHSTCGSGCSNAAACDPLPQTCDQCAGNLTFRQFQCDLRTQDMIDAGCNPCHTGMNGGAVVTVTDFLGQEAFIGVSSL